MLIYRRGFRFEVKVGGTYLNKGAGRTKRKVLGIGDEFRPDIFYSDREPPIEPGVLYLDLRSGKEYRLYLSSFIRWVGDMEE